MNSDYYYKYNKYKKLYLLEKNKLEGGMRKIFSRPNVAPDQIEIIIKNIKSIQDTTIKDAFKNYFNIKDIFIYDAINNTLIDNMTVSHIKALISPDYDNQENIKLHAEKKQPKTLNELKSKLVILAVLYMLEQLTVKNQFSFDGNFNFMSTIKFKENLTKLEDATKIKQRSYSTFTNTMKSWKDFLKSKST